MHYDLNAKSSHQLEIEALQEERKALLQANEDHHKRVLALEEEVSQWKGNYSNAVEAYKSVSAELAVAKFILNNRLSTSEPI